MQNEVIYTTFKELFAHFISGISGKILNVDPGYFANNEDMSGDKKLFSLFFSHCRSIIKQRRLTGMIRDNRKKSANKS